MLSAVFKTVGLMVHHETVGSIPMHFRQYFRQESPMKLMRLIFLLSCLLLPQACGKKADPKPIPKTAAVQPTFFQPLV